MPKFSANSRAKLLTCHPKLQALFNEVIKYVDCSVIEGFRDKKSQDEAFAKGMSKAKWPDSLHNVQPSRAVDVVPSPINWKDEVAFYHFAGFVKGVASQMKIHIINGYDWDEDGDFHDQTLFDGPHFELHKDEK